jgi:hypothetical protein
MGHRSDELERAHQGCEALEDLAVELEQTDRRWLDHMQREWAPDFLNPFAAVGRWLRQQRQ